MDGINSRVAKNRAYNAERKRMNDAFMKEIDRDKFIMQIHQKSISQIQTQIDQFYLNYAKSTGVSYQDAKKIASQMDILKFQEKAKKAVEELDFTESTNEWLKIYNLKMKVSRLELMKAQISLELHSMYDYDYKYMYSELWDEAMAEFMTQAGIMGNSAVATKEQIDKIIMMDFHGKNFSERIWGRNGYYERTQSEIFDSMSAIYTDMAGYKKERRRLMDKFETSEYEVMRLLKTEVSRVNSQARQEVYNQQGFTHYHYVAEPGACPICLKLNGKTFKVEEREIGVNAAPMHPSCRCRDYGEIELFLNGESTILQMEETPEENNLINNEQEHVVVQYNDELLGYRPEGRAEGEEVLITETMSKAGYDGVPRIVGKKEFERLKKESNFYAERAYSAENLETLKRYQEELYGGDWYVDCTVGGSQYGQGMYCASISDLNNLEGLEGIQKEMEHYHGLGKDRGFGVSRVEKLTIDKTAKILNANGDSYDVTRTIRELYYDLHMSKIEIEDKDRKYLEEIKNLRKRREKITLERQDEYHGSSGYKLLMKEAKKVNKRISQIEMRLDKYTDEIYQKHIKGKDASSLAIEMGYDIINANGHGESGTYSVVLNRTKLIFLGEE